MCISSQNPLDVNKDYFPANTRVAVDGAIAGSAPILAFAPSPGLPTVARPFGDGKPTRGPVGLRPTASHVVKLLVKVIFIRITVAAL